MINNIRHQQISMIIPTRNREKDLKICLKSINNQTIKPLEIIIINNDYKKRIVKKSVLINGIQTKLIHTKIGGAARARNIGLECVTGDIVVFLDDDVELDKDFNKNLLKIYSDSKVAGVVANIVNDVEYIEKGTVIRKIFLLYSDKPYSILSSGKNIRALINLKNKQLVEWMPGCASSIRFKILKKHRFNQQYDSMGYALGEDVDFSYKLCKQNKIIYSKETKLIHHNSPTARINEYKFGVIEIYNKYIFVKNNMNKFKNWIAFSWSVIGILILNTVMSLKNPKKFVKRVAGNLKGIIKIWY